ncbi:MAG: winged helix DNA-binding domain-containing protein, partial [Paucibacter sp.]|nr:winged helix DNA-binding domain-containing protein [Roseateles sp.]
GRVHPREVQAALALGQTRNAWGGSSNTTTHLLDGMHYRGMLRVQRREQGLRVYESVQHAAREHSTMACAQALLDLVVAKYAPLPARSLTQLCAFLRLGAPHLTREIQRVKQSAAQRYANAEVDGQRWYWPADENPRSTRWRLDDEVRLLAPFDPVVWDRFRFEQFWGWAYRFEAYTPAAKRKLGYYALPMLWQGRVLGWGNLSVKDGRLQAHFGYVDREPPGDPNFKAALAAELHRMAEFLVLAPA